MNTFLDTCSKSLKQKKTELSILYWLRSADSNKGRLFMPVYDKRFPFKFKAEYVYVAEFLEKNTVSGNHYHKIKKELVIPLRGTFKIFLEDIRTKKKETITIHSKEHKAIYINTGISHKILSKEDTGILLVLASIHSRSKDEIKYAIK